MPVNLRGRSPIQAFTDRGDKIFVGFIKGFESQETFRILKGKNIF